MSTGHGPSPIARDCGVAPAVALGLSAGHEPLRAARGLAAVVAPSLSVEHGPLHAARDRGPAAALGLRWTCSPDSFVGGQRQTDCS
ncbi:unnamed protein product [Sphagnum tenellum]